MSATATCVLRTVLTMHRRQTNEQLDTQSMMTTTEGLQCLDESQHQIKGLVGIKRMTTTIVSLQHLGEYQRRTSDQIGTRSTTIMIEHRRDLGVILMKRIECRRFPGETITTPKLRDTRTKDIMRPDSRGVSGTMSTTITEVAKTSVCRTRLTSTAAAMTNTVQVVQFDAVHQRRTVLQPSDAALLRPGRHMATLNPNINARRRAASARLYTVPEPRRRQ